MGQVLRTGSALLSHRDGRKVSKVTEAKINTLFEILRANPRVSMHTLEYLLLQIPKNENILAIHDDCGYNILQRSVGLNRVDLTRWLLHRHRPDVNRSPCSLPLHIACVLGHTECVELLLKYGARIDTESRICFPGAHSHNCVESGKYQGIRVFAPHSMRLQNAICYALDTDKTDILNLLAQKLEDPWIPFRVKKPLLHLACERGAFNCAQQLVLTRSEEINMIKDEYYPIHQAALQDDRFLLLLMQHGAVMTVRTCTQQMSLLHMVIFFSHKCSASTLKTLRMLVENGCKELINEPDSLGNTPLHALIVRLALEDARATIYKWNKWDALYMVRYLLHNGAKKSINQAGNSVMACVLRHVRDWEVCYEVLRMLSTEGADPNIVGRDGSTPIMILLIPLIKTDHLHHFSHITKVCYLNCVRILLQYGANPNCSYRYNLTPLHILIFTACENFELRNEERKLENFDFIKSVLLLLLQYGLDCEKTYQYILQAVCDMVQHVRNYPDMQNIYELTLALLQYGADPNIVLNSQLTTSSAIFSNEMANFGGSLYGAVTADNLFRNSFRTNSRYPLFYFIILISKKEFILKDPDQTFTHIINLYFLAMRHGPLYSCLKSLYNFYTAQVPSKKTAPLVTLITTLYRKPRSLKQLARIAIYEAVNRKLGQNIKHLKLPGPLKEYMLKFNR